MAKLLLVEDDNNLREIYEARLTAEGYYIVTAQNGEEALVVAKQHHPDLIISDVMMPRISGFEMLDILRNTDELRDTKVIMLTALGQAEDQARAGKLGADKYLVKSQVTLEDIVNSAKDLLEGKAAAPATPVSEPTTTTEAPAQPQPPTPVAMNQPSVPAPTPPVVEPASVPSPVPSPDPSTAVPVVTVTDPDPIAPPVAQVDPQPAPITPPVAQAAPTTTDVPAAVMPDPADVAAAAQPAATEAAIVESQVSSFTPGVQTPSILSPEAAADAANDEALTEAVDELQAAADQAPEPVLPPSQKAIPVAEATEPIAAPVAVAAPAATAVVPEARTMAEPAEETDDHVEVAGKKVIEPINDITAGPNLEDLLAKEAAKASGTTTPQPIVATATVPANPEPTSDIDPNSIAL